MYREDSSGEYSREGCHETDATSARPLSQCFSLLLTLPTTAIVPRAPSPITAVRRVVALLPDAQLVGDIDVSLTVGQASLDVGQIDRLLLLLKLPVTPAVGTGDLAGTTGITTLLSLRLGPHVQTLLVDALPARSLAPHQGCLPILLFTIPYHLETDGTIALHRLAIFVQFSAVALLLHGVGSPSEDFPQLGAEQGQLVDILVLGARDLVQNKNGVLALVTAAGMGAFAGGLAGAADVVDIASGAGDLEHLGAVRGAAEGARDDEEALPGGAVVDGKENGGRFGTEPAKWAKERQVYDQHTMEQTERRPRRVGVLHRTFAVVSLRWDPPEPLPSGVLQAAAGLQARFHRPRCPRQEMGCPACA